MSGLALQFGVELVQDPDRLVRAAVAFGVGFLATYLVGRVMVVPLLLRAMRRRGYTETLRSLTRSVAVVLVVVLAVAVAFTVSGFGAFLAAFATLGGALALAVGFAAQDLMGNFVAGVFILKDRPFDVGDWIEWEGTAGRVEAIDLRVTRVRTFDNEQITVPNSELSNNAITNPVAYNRLRQKFVFGIGYDDDIATAREVILEEVRGVEGVLEDPAPDVRVTELGDSAVGLQARFWIADPDRSEFVAVRSRVVEAVKNRFDAEGIDMPYVHRELSGELEVAGGDADPVAGDD